MPPHPYSELGASGLTQSADTSALAGALHSQDSAAAARAARDLCTAGFVDDVLNIAGTLAASNRTALNVLVETLDSSGTLRRFAGSMLLDRAAIDDVVQDSLISVVESIDAYTGGSKFTTWAHTIVKRRVVDHLRRQRDTSPLDGVDSPTARMSSMIATRTTIEESLAQLPELYREPVVLRDVRGMSYAEVASALGRSLGTVKAQISRGRAMMAGMLRSTVRADDA